MVESTQHHLYSYSPFNNIFSVPAKREVKDYCGVRQQPKILANFEPGGIHITLMICLFLETLLFSVKLKKINMFGWNQERIFVITSEYIYNIKTSKPKRKIPIHLLGGISKTMTGVKIEFTLHVPTQYDYRFLSEKYVCRT